LRIWKFSSRFALVGGYYGPLCGNPQWLNGGAEALWIAQGPGSAMQGSENSTLAWFTLAPACVSPRFSGLHGALASSCNSAPVPYLWLARLGWIRYKVGKPVLRLVAEAQAPAPTDPPFSLAWLAGL